MITSLFFLIIGLVLLLTGTEFVIGAALNVARHYKISELFIGLTIMAIGTDLPELVVDITAAIHRLKGIETSGLIIGETLGTCMSQIFLTLGLIGLFSVLHLGNGGLHREKGMLVFSALIVFLLGFDGLLSRIDGFILLIIYMVYFLSLNREENIYKKFKSLHLKKKLYPMWVFFSFSAGFAILFLGSQLTIQHALKLAALLRLPQAIIGIIALGLATSLPEIALAINSIRKKAYTLSIGNLIGSNIFDMLFTLGIGSAISGFLVNHGFLVFDFPYLIFAYLIFIYLILGKNNLHKKQAFVFLSLFFFYILIKLGTL